MYSTFEKILIVSTPVCGFNSLVVQFDKKFQDQIATPGGLTIYLTTEFEPGQHATITGKVVSIPRAFTSKFKFIDFDIMVGDELIFRYLVVHDMSQYFSYPVHENEFQYEGQSYWKVDYDHVLGYIRDGVLTAACDYVLMDDPDDEDLPEKSDGGLWIPEIARKVNSKTMKAIARHIGKPEKNNNPLQAKPGDKLLFETRFVERYTIKGKKWLISKHKRILATVKTKTLFTM